MNDRVKSLLIVDDDMVYRQRLAQAMEKRGWMVRQAESVASGIATAKAEAPEFAVVDLRLNDGSGLDIVTEIRNVNPDCRVVMLTGYGNIATAVAAVKEGAVDYLAKPADADAIEQALITHGRKLPPPPSTAPPITCPSPPTPTRSRPRCWRTRPPCPRRPSSR
jgi:two-component system response regulator RegA